MSDKDEITDLGEALVAIIKDPPETWISRDGWLWRWHNGELQFRIGGVRHQASWHDGEIQSLRDDLPIKRIRYGWVPCEREEAHQLPDGSRAYVSIPADHGKTSPMFADTQGINPCYLWVKWGRL